MLPNILDVALNYGLTFHPKHFGKKETLAKCPFCREDTQPAKQKKYYLSLNTKDNVFKCWFWCDLFRYNCVNRKCGDF